MPPNMDQRPYEPDSTSNSSSSAPFLGVPSGERVLKPGERIGGFQVLEVLGAGGMAVVYKSLQLSLNRPVALKILNSRFSRDPAFIQRFEQEAGALAALNHPNIVNVIDKGQAENLYYFVMEYVPGTSLDKAIIEGHLTISDYLIIIMGIRDALTYVHSRGIVHRDIKPANILLSDEGRVKVSDFGIAHIAWGDPKLQKSGKSQFGTSYYMAPEQAEQGKTVDARADIYALGVTYYKMFTREIPQGSFAGPATINTQLPPDVDPIILKALQSNPANRYQTVEEFCNDLITVLWDHSGLADGEGTPGAPAGGRDSSGRIVPPPYGASPLPIPGQAISARPSATFPSLPKSAAPMPPRPRPTGQTPPPPQQAAPPPVITDKDLVKPGKKDKPKKEAPKKEKAEKKEKKAPPIGDKKAKTGLIIAIVALVLAGLAGGGYYWYAHLRPEAAPSLSDLGTSTGPAADQTPAPTVPGGNPFEGNTEGKTPPDSAPSPTDIPPPPPTSVPSGPVQQVLVAIPAGPVQIGDPNSRWASPTRVVDLPAFQIEKYEVSNWMYSQFVKAVGHTPPPYWRGGEYPAGRDNEPVVEVSLHDAMAYAKWAGRDIPTEEQWERAARGANGWIYPWGQEWKEGAANILTNQLLPINAPGWRDVTMEASGEGCFFLAGNVMEWTQSRFAPYPGGLMSASRFSPTEMAVRGGAFVFRTRDRVNPVFMARAGARAHVVDPGVRLDNLGFRCVVNTP